MELSKQRRYQLQHAARGLCMLCPAPAVNATFCLKHAIAQRELQRRRAGNIRRYHNAQTYRLEAL